MIHDQGKIVDFLTWQATPYSQDSGSNFNSTNSPTVTPGPIQPTATPTPVSNPNLTTNAFDADTATLEGSIGKWVVWFSANIFQSTTTAHSGTHSLEVDVTAPYGWGIQLSNWPGFAVTPGSKTVSFWAKSGTGSTGVTMQMKWMNATQSVLQTDFVTIPTLSSSWQQGLGNIVVPAGTTSVLVYVNNASGSTGDVVYMDDFVIADNSTSATPTPVLGTPKTATIDTIPSQQSVNVGDTFPVAIRIDGHGSAFNASQANITVSPNLTITSLTPGNCNFTYTYTPTAQSPSYAGAIFSSSSTQCTIYTLNLKANVAGTGTVTITNGAVKAYPSSAEIFLSKTDGNYTLASSGGGTSTPTPTPPIPTPTTIPGATVTPIPTPTPTTPPGTRKPADFNNDGLIDTTDFSIFAIDWERTTANLANPYTDITQDGIVDLTDFSLFARDYGM